jgi:hypothetical protein
MNDKIRKKHLPRHAPSHAQTTSPRAKDFGESHRDSTYSTLSSVIAPHSARIQQSRWPTTWRPRRLTTPLMYVRSLAKCPLPSFLGALTVRYGGALATIPHHHLLTSPLRRPFRAQWQAQPAIPLVSIVHVWLAVMHCRQEMKTQRKEHRTTGLTCVLEETPSGAKEIIRATNEHLHNASVVRTKFSSY